jgi:hypothetical protein
MFLILLKSALELLLSKSMVVEITQVILTD